MIRDPECRRKCLPRNHDTYLELLDVSMFTFTESGNLP